MINPGDVNIAVVGIGCKYPGANNVQEYWENTLALRQQFRQLPKGRLDLDYYGSEDNNLADYTYLKKAALLNGYEFDRIKYRVSRSTFEQTDMTHWLALDVATEALKDAGFENGEGLDRQRVGVILGNSLTGEFTRSNTMRLRWPYVSKVLQQTLTGLSYTEGQISDILAQTETNYKAPFPIPDADTLAGGLSNTIAGRICNYFDFNGGGFTVDGACSSSLLSTAIGCNGILNGDLDVVLVGGVDLSVDPFEIIGFTRNGALARKEMEVYSSRSEGFWPGEGCGMLVLMKETLAREKGLEIYGNIRGWGISSDGKGGITRPKSATQRKAIERAYAKAGYGINSVAMFEGHGTGTPIGDKVELEGLISALRGADKQFRAATIGSVKHLIGHTKAAAGVAGIIKTCLAIKNNIIPPSRPNLPHKLLRENKDVLKLSYQPEVYADEIPMRGSISSMGFGGINVHVTIERDGTGKSATRLSPKVRKLTASNRDYEVLALAANSRDNLLGQIDKWLKVASAISRAEFIDLVATDNANFRCSGNWRAAVVAKCPDDLSGKLTILQQWLNASETSQLDADQGVFFDGTGRKARIGFLFPGQGAPISRTDGVFTPFVQNILGKRPQEVVFTGAVADTSVAQPVIVERSLRAAELLSHFGVEADLAVGNSLGEISALSWARALDAMEASRIASQRGKAMSLDSPEPSLLLAIQCDDEQIQDFVTDSGPWITGFNGKGNFVVGGSAAMIAKAEEHAVDASFPNTRLKVSHAFHTPYMKAATERFSELIKGFNFKALDRKVISTVTGERLTSDTCLERHLLDQIEQPVRFTQAIEKGAAEVDMFIEVGPGTALTKSLHNTPGVTVLPTEYGGDSLRSFLKVLAGAFVSGAPVDFADLSVDRFYRPTNLDEWSLNVLVNPCEKVQTDITPLLQHEKTVITKTSGPSAAIDSLLPQKLDQDGVLKHLKELISQKIEIPVTFISDQDKIMSELHLNSLAITEIISLATKVFKKDHKTFSAASLLANDDATIEEVSKVIFLGNNGKSTATNKINTAELYKESENWTHSFRKVRTEKSRSKIKVNNGVTAYDFYGDERLMKKFASTVKAEQQENLGRVALFFSSGDDSPKSVERFLALATSSLPYQIIALVEIGTTNEDIGLSQLFQTLQLENRESVVVRINFPATFQNLEAVLCKELTASTRYREVFYDRDEKRSEAEFTTYFPSAPELNGRLTAKDVILATGGGKGITFASAKRLAIFTGARLILLGRSAIGSSEELDSNLLALKESGIIHEYRSVDVMDVESLKIALRAAEENLGPVTVVLHGAGINQPKMLSQLQLEDFERTESIKVQGLDNVLSCLANEQLRFVVGFGSIIGRSGMQGNADYAMANNKLANTISALNKLLPTCRCVTLEWSIWEETGMGVKLDILSGLKSRGVWPIPLEAGLQQLINHLGDTGVNLPTRIVIGGRYGKMPTLPYLRRKYPEGRFIGKILDGTPGVELISDVSINRTDDIYLENHVFQGQYIFPTVMILEGMAQCCRAIGGDFSQVTFSNLEIEKSIFIPANAANIIRFIVVRISQHEYVARVRSEDSNFEVDCFRARISTEAISARENSEYAASNDSKLPVDVNVDFYDSLLFHRGPFRRIQRFEHISASATRGVISEEISGKWFGDYVHSELLLGDPGINDAAIHCNQVCRPGFTLLPVRSDRIVFHRFTFSGPLYINAVEVKEQGTETVINVFVTDKNGKIIQEWQGLILAKVGGTAFSGVWNPVLLETYLEYKLRKEPGKTDSYFPKEKFSSLLAAFASTRAPIRLEDENFEISLLPGRQVSEKNEQLIQIAGISDPILLRVKVHNSLEVSVQRDEGGSSVVSL